MITGYCKFCRGMSDDDSGGITGYGYPIGSLGNNIETDRPGGSCWGFGYCTSLMEPCRLRFTLILYLMFETEGQKAKANALRTKGRHLKGGRGGGAPRMCHVVT